MQLTLSQARALHLAAQGLHRRPRRRARKPDALATIRRMRALQIDTIHVVERSPYLVLFSRLGPYPTEWLDALLEEGRIFEYWAHEACFLPVEDYPLYRERMLEPGDLGWKYSHEWVEEHRGLVERVLTHVREEGPVRAADLGGERRRGASWWGWKPEKRALEMLFSAGELMVARRHRFQRVYDLRERVLPDWDDARLPSPEETRRALVLAAVRALGLARAAWVADYFRMDKTGTPGVVAQLAAAGELLEARVPGWDDVVYIHPENLELAERAAGGRIRPSLTTLLSPFDPVVWDRRRALELFGFDYRLECYTPAEKRRWGYFVLPILRRGALVGRLDAKAHRKSGVFEVKALYLEEGVRASDRLVDDVSAAIAECAAWHGTPEVRIGRTEPEEVGGRLAVAVAG